MTLQVDLLHVSDEGPAIRDEEARGMDELSGCPGHLITHDRPPVDRSLLARHSPGPLEREEHVPHNQQGASRKGERAPSMSEAVVETGRPDHKAGRERDEEAVAVRRLLVALEEGHDQDHRPENAEEPDCEASIAPP